MPAARAAVSPAPRLSAEVRESREPEPEPDAALAAVVLLEICGTTVRPSAGRLAGAAYPLIAGHGTAGGLERIRSAQRDVDGRALAEGRRATRLPDELSTERTARQARRRCWHAAAMPVRFSLQPAGVRA